ncbi:MAG: ISKra4 family transposase [Candidatus Dormibacteraeota bacterium]|nr:ISKra4 family transposase [Candidatus Dormibacteraeota bacterium]
MDRVDLSETIIQDVSAIVAEELRAAGPELLTADLDGMEARLQQMSRRVCGATLERVLAVRAVPRGERPPCPTCGGVLRLVDGARGRDLQGLTGDATLVRPTYVCTRADCGRGHAPLDAELGLGAETLMPRLARVVCRAGITGAFDEAATQLREDHSVALGGETVRRVTEAVGAVAEAAQQEDIGRARGGALTRPAGGATDVVLAVDGCQVPLRDGWHEMKVGRAAPLGPAQRTDHRTGRTFLAWGDAAICAGLEGAEEFWYRACVTAWRGGLGRQTRRVIVLGDGAEWIWNRAAQFVGGPGITVVEILDLFHAYEHLWEAGRAVFDTPDALAAWAEPLKDALYEQGAPAILAALDALTPPTSAAAEVLRRERAYFADNATRMDYPRYVAAHLPIGSGAVESLCKTLIEAREKGAGMRWTRAGAQAVATLRAVRASGDWAAFWATHPLRARLRLCPPARPRRRTTVVTPLPDADLHSPLRVAPQVVKPLPAPAPSVAPDPAAPARRPAATHPWRRAPIGRARCA